jgi:hypothetical protein
VKRSEEEEEELIKAPPRLDSGAGGYFLRGQKNWPDGLRKVCRIIFCFAWHR